MYGNPAQVSPLCGKSLTITDEANGKSATAVVADICPTCGHAADLDLSIGLFESLAGSLGNGLINVEWHYNN
jgi:expansin (peptidoglycan-binding protein)